MTNIRTVLGSMDLDESLSKRDEINARLLRVVDEATHPWGVKVNRIEIKDIAPPRDLIDAMARQMKAEREKRANILDAEGFRQAAILKAEGEKQSVILAAEGEKEAAFRAAEARERTAEAEAKATTMVSEAIASGNVNALNYFVANNYIEALKEMAHSPNQKMLLLPIEATGVIGAMAGIDDLATCRALSMVDPGPAADCRRAAGAGLFPVVDRPGGGGDGLAAVGRALDEPAGAGGHLRRAGVRLLRRLRALAATEAGAAHAGQRATQPARRADDRPAL